MGLCTVLGAEYAPKRKLRLLLVEYLGKFLSERLKFLMYETGVKVPVSKANGKDGMRP